MPWRCPSRSIFDVHAGLSGHGNRYRSASPQRRVSCNEPMTAAGPTPPAAAKGKPVARGCGPRQLSDRDLAETGKQSLQHAALYAERRLSSSCWLPGCGHPQQLERWRACRRDEDGNAGDLDVRASASDEVADFPLKGWNPCRGNAEGVPTPTTGAHPARAWNPAASWIGRWARQRVFSGHLVSVTRIRTSLVFDRAMMALLDGGRCGRAGVRRPHRSPGLGTMMAAAPG
jgi:hypothetical protein